MTRRVPYVVMTPEGFADGQTRPLALLFPPGDQTRAMTERALARYMLPLREAGWVVVGLVAEEGTPLLESGSALLPQVIDDISRVASPEWGLVHVVGVSSGGRAAMRASLAASAKVASLTVLPGFLPNDTDVARADALKDVPVTLFVGELDAPFLAESRRTHEALRARGVSATLEVLPEQAHVLTLGEGQLRGLLERRREQARDRAQTSAARTEVEAVLDALHAAAARADFQAYFACFAPDAVFMGTDATERWTIEEFQAFARPIFQAGRGWAYFPGARFVTFSPGLDVAWFDEMLTSRSYGTCRGSGVLVRREGRWLVAQYNLSIPLPNALAPRVVEMIRGATAQPEGVRQPR